MIFPPIVNNLCSLAYIARETEWLNIFYSVCAFFHKRNYVVRCQLDLWFPLSTAEASIVILCFERFPLLHSIFTFCLLSASPAIARLCTNNLGVSLCVFSVVIRVSPPISSGTLNSLCWIF